VHGGLPHQIQEEERVGGKRRFRDQKYEWGLNRMPEIMIILDQLNGAMLIEGPDRLSAETLRQMTGLAGAAREIGCARPIETLPPPIATAEERAASDCVRIAGYYHNSLTEGPGRRSSVLFQSCPLACKGCWVPELHDSNEGVLVPASRLAAALLDPDYQRDGISILGGEPFAQPGALSSLVRELRARGCSHILCYSGYTYEALRERAKRRPAISDVLDELDILVDGPYIEALAVGAGAWTGSSNQRVIDLAATRRKGQVVLC
jgi:anaerobic ribonucleoside-triphosphate reductase activating protein